MQAAVIGLGQMGAGIARNLDRHTLLAGAWDVMATIRAAQNLSCALCPPKALAGRADALIFVVPSSHEIEACLEGPDGILAHPAPGQIVIDLTTSRPADTRRLAARAAQSGRIYLDGGMSGGATGADAGTLTLMMGGDAHALQRCRPLLEAIATRIFHLGPVGAGHTMKLVHNMVCHTNFMALVEAGQMAEQAGLPLFEVIAVINAGNARSYISEARFPNHILSGRFDGRSRVSNLAKDLAMAAELAASLDRPAPYTNLTASLLDQALARGQADADFTTLYKSNDA